ncbi:hypothetical protein NMG60_11005420 [Bertholletia excelsa]
MMDIISSASTSVSEDIKSSSDLRKLYPELKQCDDGVMQPVSLNYLENNVIELLCDTLAANSILPQLSDKKRNGNVEKEDQCEEAHQHDSNGNVEREDQCEEANQHDSNIITSRECLSGAANSLLCNEKTTFAVSTDGEYKVSEDQEVQDNLTAAILKQSGYSSLPIDGEDEQEEDDLSAAVTKQYGYESVVQSNPQSISPVTPLKLVSALKGSREKQGLPAKKLTVTWAADVYDPLHQHQQFSSETRNHCPRMTVGKIMMLRKMERTSRRANLLKGLAERTKSRPENMVAVLTSAPSS